MNPTQKTKRFEQRCHRSVNWTIHGRYV